jgi:hypothetical protein
MQKCIILSQPGVLIMNDGTHDQHTPENPDDGSISKDAVALAAKLAEYGIVAVAERME